MATDTPNDLVYYMVIDQARIDDLANVRAWSSLKVAFEEGEVWVKDFTHEQVHAVAVRSIPHKTLYYAQSSKLFLLNSLLPARNIPSLLWTPIERALPIQLPPLNHRFFTLQSPKASVRIVPSATAAEAIAMLVALELLGTYLTTAPAWRLERLKWVILPNSKALLIGKPLLPIPGETFWHREDFLIPTGYDLNLPILAKEMNEALNPGYRQWLVWDTSHDYFCIDKQDLKTLSLSSFRSSTLPAKQL